MAKGRRMKSDTLYQGYVIREHKGYTIYKDDKVVCSQPSLEFAYRWIEREIKEKSNESYSPNGTVDNR